MLVQFTDDLNPLSQSEVFEAMVGRFISDIARGASFIRQRSMMLSIADNRQSLADRRERLDEATAEYVTRLINLAQEHGLEPLRGLGMIDLEIVRLATAPLNRKENGAPAAKDREPLATFTNEALVEALYGLAHALRAWEWTAATESCEENSPEDVGDVVLDRLVAATVAAWDQIGPAVTERLAQPCEEGRS